MEELRSGLDQGCGCCRCISEWKPLISNARKTCFQLCNVFVASKSWQCCRFANASASTLRYFCTTFRCFARKLAALAIPWLSMSMLVSSSHQCIDTLFSFSWKWFKILFSSSHRHTHTQGSTYLIDASEHCPSPLFILSKDCFAATTASSAVLLFQPVAAPRKLFIFIIKEYIRLRYQKTF